MNYTRKRALLACDFCRHRKRRCDGERPCSTCRESNADCRYKDLPVERVESPSSASNEAVVERLNRIEALLEEQAQRLSEIVQGVGNTAAAAAVAAASVIDTADGQSIAPPSSRLSHPSLYLVPEGVVTTAAAAAAAGSAAAVSAVGAASISSATSPSAPARSPIVGGQLPLALDGVAQQLLAQQAVTQPGALSPAASSSAFLATAATRSPLFGFSTTAVAPPFPANQQAFIGGGPRPLMLARAPSVSSSDVSSHNNPDKVQFLIPYAHSTSANTLLSLPLVRFYLSNSSRRNTPPSQPPNSTSTSASSTSNSFYYPRTYFFDIEKSQPLSHQLDLIRGPGLVPPVWPPQILTSSHPSVMDGLAKNYFALVHPDAPLFSRAEFREWATRVYEMGPNDTIEMALCLCVWALGALVGQPGTGSIATPPPTPAQQAERDQVALSLFQPAFRIIMHHATWSFGPASLATCQALLLAASYFAYMARPLHNAQMVRTACHHFLQLFDERKRDGLDPASDDKVLRVFWVCFMWECDRAAELDVPRSGVEPLADDMPLPSSFDPEESDDMIYFVAETAVRRLLNRIHSSFYAAEDNEGGVRGGVGAGTGSIESGSANGLSSGRTTPGFKRKRSDSDHPGLGGTTYSNSYNHHHHNLSKMLPVATELNRQLEAWFRAIPDHLRPPLETFIGSDNVLGGALSRSPVSGGGSSSSDGDNENDEEDAEGEDDPDHLNRRASRTNSNTTARSQAPSHSQSSHAAATNQRGKILRMRYYDAQHIIHRPFLLSVAWHQQLLLRGGGGGNGGGNSGGGSGSASNNTISSAGAGITSDAPPPAFLDKCIACIDSCVAYIEQVAPLLDRRSPYLWSFSQTCMACLVVLVVVDCSGIGEMAAAREAAALNAAGRRRQKNQQNQQNQQQPPRLTYRGRPEVARLRYLVASKLRRWVLPGNMFEALLRVVERLPVR